MKKVNKLNPEISEILQELNKLLNEKKCEDIQFMDLQDVNSYLTYFVLATTKTATQARSVAREVDRYMKPRRKGMGVQSRTIPVTSAAKDTSGWLLLDYGDIIVHIMEPDVRTYYDLEKLWGDAQFLNIGTE